MFEAPHPFRLIMPSTLLQHIDGEARSTYPEEACGFLIGRTQGANLVVWAVRGSPNASSDSRRNSYSIPVDWILATQTQTRGPEWRVIGIYHSHPDQSAVPSQRDLAEAWPELVYLILSVRPSEVCTPRAWQLKSMDMAFQELELTLDLNGAVD